MIINPYRYSGGGVEEFDYIGFTANTANTATYTFSSVSLGAADSNRETVVAYASRAGSNATVTSATINGVTATIHVQYVTAGNTVAILSAATPSDATGDVVVNMSASSVRAGCYVYRSTLASFSVDDTDSGLATSATETSFVMTTSADGHAVAIAMTVFENGFTWTGVTEDSADYVEGTDIGMSCANAATDGTNLTVECLPDNNNSSVCAMTFS